MPASVLELDDVSAYDVSQANLKLALAFSKAFAVDGKKVAVLLPDEAEAGISIETMGGSSNPYPDIQISSLRKSEEGDKRIFKVRTIIIDQYEMYSPCNRPCFAHGRVISSLYKYML